MKAPPYRLPPGVNRWSARTLHPTTTQEATHRTNTTASPWAGAVGPAVRATGSTAARQIAVDEAAKVVEAPPGSLTAKDDVDRALEELGVPRPADPDWDPRAAMPLVTSMSNVEIADMLVRLSAERERVGRLLAKQDFIVGELMHKRRDREVEVRFSVPPGPARNDDIVWRDPVYRKLNEVLLLQQRVKNELAADAEALDRHFATVSRVVEVRRQEQQQELISNGISSRKTST